ncbi:TPA: dTDP-4-dehydrorhamnose 3,5-epimerase [Providencia rettgeri]|uniref:dTDP-4-dehydrorhamnose 3,5-epimerase n=1 Tax=Providencia sp. PROV141 TaxID=2949851 RepID=UPI001B93BB9A|nr:dTDP-4-dehydrorhamnose 3,5-epimerase [Providencia sp. PROV141]HBC7429872.1 dTDP-4-dehydrorhamnose 3,5-epimerase [Providencia rettgeri]
MIVLETNIPEVKIIEPQVFGDDRGFFLEIWQQEKFEEKITNKPTDFVQDNISKSRKGILRGLHYQTKNTQGKLVSVILGEVFDVAVDIRANSPTFGKWVGVYLSDKNKRQLWVPEGFAHGFYVTSDEAVFHYKCTNYYDPLSEQTIMWNDSNLSIEWPLCTEHPVLSEKDKKGILFNQAAYL